MPNNIIKSFADKSGKTESEVEKLWNELKTEYKDDYEKITGTLKKILKIDEVILRGDAVLSSKNKHNKFRPLERHIIYKTSEYKLYDINKYIILTDTNDNQLFYIKLERKDYKTLTLGARENLSNTPNLFFKVIYTLLYLGYKIIEDWQHNDLSIKSIQKLIKANIIKVKYDNKDITKDLIDNNFNDDDINKTFSYELKDKNKSYLLENNSMFENDDLFQLSDKLIKNTILKVDEASNSVQQISLYFIDYLKDKFNIKDKVLLKIKKSSKSKYFGDVDYNSMIKGKFIINVEEGSLRYVLSEIAHEFTHIVQFKNNNLYVKDNKFYFNKKEFITVDEYNNISNYTDYYKLPWEAEAKMNEKILVDEFMTNNGIGKLKGKDNTIDFIISLELNEASKGTYVARKIKNAESLYNHYKNQGVDVVPMEELHCTIAYSKKEFKPELNSNEIEIMYDEDIYPYLEPLGDDGCIVMKFKSKEMTERWQDCINRGAIYDYENYIPHITITINGKDLDLKKINKPDFNIILNDEYTEELDLNWKDKLTVNDLLESTNIKSIKEKFKDYFKKINIYEYDNKVSIDLIITNEKNQGYGTKLMNEIIDYCDKTNKTIILTPSDEFGGNKKRLIEFYKRFGFLENKGKNKIFGIFESMYRLPKNNKNEDYKGLNMEIEKLVEGLGKAKLSFVTKAMIKEGLESLTEDKLNEYLDLFEEYKNVVLESEKFATLVEGKDVDSLSESEIEDLIEKCSEEMEDEDDEEDDDIDEYKKDIKENYIGKAMLELSKGNTGSAIENFKSAMLSTLSKNETYQEIDTKMSLYVDEASIRDKVKVNGVSFSDKYTALDILVKKTGFWKDTEDFEKDYHKFINDEKLQGVSRTTLAKFLNNVKMENNDDYHRNEKAFTTFEVEYKRLNKLK